MRGESDLGTDEAVVVDSTTANAISLWSNSEEDHCCRVCHGAAEESRQLFHPCRCSGSIKFVHQDCLETWLKVSNKSHPKCELCGELFNFRTIYTTGGEGKPPKLSIFEFASVIFFLSCSVGGRTLFITSKIVLTFGVWFIGCPICIHWWMTISDWIAFGNDSKYLLIDSYQTKNFVDFIIDFTRCW
jgi:E3 ubiquitin-protein ligase DOA10